MEKIENKVLDAFLQSSDSGRFTSQDIADTLRDTIDLSPRDITLYMLERNWNLKRVDDRLVWCR